MFGDVTFAQAPFAALGGSAFFADASEAGSASASFDARTNKGGNQEESSAAEAFQSVLANMLASQAESATGSDSVLNAANILRAVAAEFATGAAAQSNTANMLASQAESAQGDDILLATAVLYSSLTEQASGSDTVIRAAVFPVAVSESAAGQDSSSRVIVRVATVAEYAGVSAALTPFREANVYPSGVQLLLNIGGVLVWAVIDDTQNPNWQNIVNAQGSGWTILPS